ncbi:hypothetical protein caldi_28180 [Caldinitratiruptor microaerophilus]|uniref:UDP-2,4-diacetamido-2,4, 6-trideoxy-beta-L-altropyranose hydrolase n=1 Tax=Caldinitratiruptor microaerophilus TaxID=671077 RepID=A0AA35G9Q5_9FIRM|nr:hypothetical protein caldi_28180 [Caldinitratiruptor microaerophilus]
MVRKGLRALLRPDAGASFGLGHLRRSLALGTVLMERGVTCAVATEEDPFVRAIVTDQGFSYIPASEPSDAAQTIGRATVRGTGFWGNDDTVWDILVVDSYRMTPDRWKEARDRARTLVAIDDTDEPPEEADLVLQIRPLSSSSSTGTAVLAPRGRQVLRGPEYALLGSPYRSLPRRVPSARVQSSVVTLGGTDPWGFLPRLVSGLRHVLGTGERLHVVVGPFASSSEFLRMLHRDQRIEIVENPSPAELAALLTSADMAISGGGQSLYEMAAAGVPCIVVQVAENQATNIQGFVALGSIVYAGPAGADGTVQRVVEEYIRLRSDWAARAAMARRGQETVDGKGALRVASSILQRHIGARGV